jgi:carboxypeptidase C (cathepsin A)
MGNQAWTEALDWPGAKKFQSATTKDFKVKKNGKSAGVYKSAEGFTFMRVYPYFDRADPVLGVRRRSHVFTLSPSD